MLEKAGQKTWFGMTSRAEETCVTLIKEKIKSIVPSKKRKSESRKK